MNLEKFIDELIGVIELGKFDVIICNYLNGDMVGYIGDFNVVVKVCEVVDYLIGWVIELLKKVGGECLIIVDYGNVE